jgi:molybdenum cofactor cytidylyltransferase
LLGFEVVRNPRPEQGLSRSLAYGIVEVARGEARAVLVCLADMPFVSVHHLRNLLAGFDPESTPVVASESKRVPMPPALFARSLFGQLQQLKGDTGARALLRSALLIAAPTAELADIDRPEDLPRDS